MQQQQLGTKNSITRVWKQVECKKTSTRNQFKWKKVQMVHQSLRGPVNRWGMYRFMAELKPDKCKAPVARTTWTLKNEPIGRLCKGTLDFLLMRPLVAVFIMTEEVRWRSTEWAGRRNLERISGSRKQKAFDRFYTFELKLWTMNPHSERPTVSELLSQAHFFYTVTSVVLFFNVQILIWPSFQARIMLCDS